MTADDAIAKAALAYLPATYKRALMHLSTTPCDAKQLANYLRMTHGSAYKLLMKLRELGVICVVEYPEPGHKVWGVGTRNVRPPAKRTTAERTAAWRARQATPRLGLWGL